MLGFLYGLIVFHSWIQVSAFVTAFFPWMGQSYATGAFLMAVALGLGACFFDRTHYTGYSKETKLARWKIWLCWFVVAFCLAIYASLFVAAYVMYDHTFDGRVYHLPVVHEWLIAGRLQWLSDRFMWSDYMNGYPKAVEAFLYMLVGATNDPRWGNAGNLFFIPLGVAGIYVISRLLGVCRLLAFLAGMLFVLVPNNMAQATQCYVDTAHASTAIASIALMCVFLTQDEKNKDKKCYFLLIMLGLALGLAAGTKGLGLIVMTIVTSACLLKCFYNGKKYCFEKPAWGKALQTGSLIGVFCLLVGGYWYLNLWIRTGNPFFPIGLHLAGFEVFKGTTIVDELLRHMPQQLASLPRLIRPFYVWLQFDGWPMNLRRVDPRLAGLGFIWIWGCVPAITVLYVKAWQKSRSAQSGITIELWLTTVLVSIFLLSPSNWWPRFVLTVFGLGLPAFAVCVANYGRRKYIRTWVFICLFAAFLEASFCLYWFVRPAMIKPLSRYPLAVFSVSAWRESYAAFSPEFARERIWPSIGPDEPVAIYEGQHLTAVGDLGMRLGRGRVYALGAHPTEEDVGQLVNMGVRKFIWACQEVPEALLGHLVQDGVNDLGMHLLVVEGASDVY